MKIISNVLYVSATTSLLVGSVITFEVDEIADYFYLVGTTLEFSDGLNGKGFVFNNPNASRTCGCGESFSL